MLTIGYNDEMAVDGPPAAAMEVLGKPYKRSELIDRVQSAEPGRETSGSGHAQA